MTSEQPEKNKYLNGKIYKIINSQNDQCYVGGTTQKYLCARFAMHKYNYTLYCKGVKKNAYTASCDIFKYDGCKIILLEAYSCNSRDELSMREQHYINTTPNCINKRNAKKDVNYSKEYHKKNYDAISKIKKEYYLKNIEKKKEYGKKYYLSNKDKILGSTKNKEYKKEYQKAHYLKNKEYMKEYSKAYRLKKKQLKNAVI